MFKDNPIAFCEDCFLVPCADWSERTLCVDCWEVFKPERIKAIKKRKQVLVAELLELLGEERRIIQTMGAYRLCGEALGGLFDDNLDADEIIQELHKFLQES